MRDELLGLLPEEKDWLVTGATVEQLLALGFHAVGKDFPVFLHPETKEEYALARTERKAGHGYGGFTFHTAPDVTVEQDLYRRDLTINAMAKDRDGNLIDPYNGRDDLKNRKLRHVSPAFIEDPLRILRVARFLARFASLGFTVADETLALMKTVTLSGELQYLAKERIWQETLRAVNSTSPDVYFYTLQQCNALDVFFPELVTAYKVIKPEMSPPRQAMIMAAKDGCDAHVRFACGFTPWEACLKEPVRAYKLLVNTLKKLKVPSSYKKITLLTTKCIPQLLSLKKNDAEEILQLIEVMDAFRQRERFPVILTACEYLLKAANRDTGQTAWLEKAALSCRNICVQSLINEGVAGRELAEKKREIRLMRIKEQHEGS